MLKFLVDAGVGRSVEKVLCATYDVLSVLDLDPCLPDTTILKMAAEQHRIIVTMDKDFGDLIFANKLPHAGVLLLRLENAAAAEKAAIVTQIMEKYTEHLPNNFSVYQAGKLRVRHIVK